MTQGRGAEHDFIREVSRIFLSISRRLRFHHACSRWSVPVGFVHPANIKSMKQILLSLAFVGFAVSSATAGCGKTVTNKGKLKSFNAETKALVVEEGGKEVKLTLTASAKGADGLDKLVGKKVTVISSHGKVESVDKS
jgi:hypothetical protein